MKYSTRVKPISYLKSHAAEIAAEINQIREPMMITQNGEAKMVLMDVKSYEEQEATFALLKLLAMGNAEIRGGYDLGVFKSTIEEYSDASELYKTMLKEKIKKIFFMNDRTRFANHLRSMIIPKL